MVCKLFFCSEFPDIPQKSRRGKKTGSKTIAKRYALQANAIKMKKLKTKYSINFSPCIAGGIIISFFANFDGTKK